MKGPLPWHDPAIAVEETKVDENDRVDLPGLLIREPGSTANWTVPTALPRLQALRA